MSRRPLTSSLVAAVALVAATVPLAPAPARAHGPALRAPRIVGYRVFVEPEILDTGRGLKTHGLTWSLRALVEVGGTEIRVRPASVEHADVRILIDRAWTPGDEARGSELFVDLAQARRHFQAVHETTDPTLLAFPTWPRVAPAPERSARAPEPRPRPKPADPIDKQRTCREVLLDLGHHPQHLPRCKGVDDRCAEKLLEAGHHPQHLDRCR